MNNEICTDIYNANERITESIVRDKFKPYTNQGFIIEEQQS